MLSQSHLHSWVWHPENSIWGWEKSSSSRLKISWKPWLNTMMMNKFLYMKWISRHSTNGSTYTHLSEPKSVNRWCPKFGIWSWIMQSSKQCPSISNQPWYSTVTKTKAHQLLLVLFRLLLTIINYRIEASNTLKKEIKSLVVNSILPKMDFNANNQECRIALPI